MKFGKILIVVGLIAVGILSLNFQAWAGNPPPESPTIQGNEYWGVVILACTNLEVSVRVKRVVDCVVETDSLIERYPVAICPAVGAPDFTANAIVGQWFGYDGVFFGEPGVPIITKVKNIHKKVYSDPGAAGVPNSGSGEYAGEIYSADVQIRFCTNCAAGEVVP
jgi:hypothetical protein